MRYLGKDDYRMLAAIEMGMRNHDLVPIELIVSIAKLRHGGAHKILSNLLRYKLLGHENQSFNGYRLNYMGYDILALKALLQRNVIASVGAQIGIGKESDIFEAQDEHGNELVLKIHRLGRTSFRAVRSKRDYMQGKSKTSWLYMSRLAAMKEFAFMQALYAHGFPTPVPIDHNRHIVAMSRVSGFPMAQIKSGNMDGAESVFRASMDILKRLAQCGLVHCDFNEFNLMVSPEDGHVTLIDFPQMVSTNHYNASELFARDLGGLIKFFAMKMKYHPSEDDVALKLEDIPVVEANLDLEIQAAGFSNEDGDELMAYMGAHATNGEEEEEGDVDSVEGLDDGCEEEEEDRYRGGEKEAEGAIDTVFGKALPSSSSSPTSERVKKEAEGDVVVGEEEDDDDNDNVSELGSDEDPEAAFDTDDKPQLLTGEELAKAREEARYKVNRNNNSSNRRGGAGGKGGGKARNSSKEVTKYGKKVHREKIDYF
jgi:RIO kinase 2